jgi:hypothetical protein
VLCLRLLRPPASESSRLRHGDGPNDRAHGNALDVTMHSDSPERCVRVDDLRLAGIPFIAVWGAAPGPAPPGPTSTSDNLDDHEPTPIGFSALPRWEYSLEERPSVDRRGAAL